MTKNFGFKVDVRFKEGSSYGTIVTLHNVTEIHHNYATFGGGEQRIAFESDIQGTGCTYPIAEIAEYEAILEKRKALVFAVE